jgi:hypothetical protein
MQSQRFPLFPSFHPQPAVSPSTAWGTVAGPVWPGRAVAGPVGRTAPWLWRFGGHHPPLRPGAASWASGIPAGSSLPTPWIRGPRHSFGASRPADSDTPLPGRPSSRGGEPEAQALPRVGTEAGPGGGSPQYRSRLSALVAEKTSLHDTTGQQSGTPCGSRFGLAYSPGLPLWCERLIPGPSGFPPRACTTTSRRGFAALRYGHHPGPPTRPAFTPRGSPVSRLLPRQYALMTRQPCCGNRTPHPTRFQARIGGPECGGQYPWALGFP